MPRDSSKFSNLTFGPKRKSRGLFKQLKKPNSQQTRNFAASITKIISKSQPSTKRITPKKPQGWFSNPDFGTAKHDNLKEFKIVSWNINGMNARF